MSRSVLLVFALLVTLALGGCIGPAALDPDAAAAAAALPRLTTAAATTSGAEPLVWTGARLSGSGTTLTPGVRTPTSCSPESCERIPFRLDLPDGYWDAHPGFVELSIEWDHLSDDYPSVSTQAIPMGHYLGLARLAMHARLLDAEGNVVQEGVESFHYASLVLAENLPPGDYVAEVEALSGEGAYVGVLQVEPAPRAEPGDQLPDLVIMPPEHLTLRHPIGREAPDPLRPAGRQGCDPDEAFEFGAVKCLRFATGFGNAGVGRLEMHLSYEDSAAATTGVSAWRQRIFDDAGDHREVVASPASYHKVHGHYHILGLDVSTVYAYDLDTRTRGEPVNAGHKTGFCPSDSALVAPFALGTTYPVAYEGCCYMWGFCQLDLATGSGYVIGLSPGWYDVYPWWRADQYVDVAGAPDGVYELETCANPDGFIVETRSDNNCGSAVFRMTGDEIEVLETWSQAGARRG